MEKSSQKLQISFLLLSLEFVLESNELVDNSTKGFTMKLEQNTETIKLCKIVDRHLSCVKEFFLLNKLIA